MKSPNEVMVEPATMPLRIAYIAGQLSLGGAEQQLYYLLQGLDRSRFCPIVISLGARPNEYWTTAIAELGIPVYHISRSVGRAARALQIAKVLYCTRTQVVHGWVLHTNPYSALAGRMAAVPIRVGSLRGSYDRIPRNTLVRWTAYIGLDCLVTNSETAAKGIQKARFPQERIRVVPNGVCPPAPVTEEMRNSLKSELGFSVEHRLIGTIGRLDGNKNHGMLLRVFSRLADKWKELRLLIVGDGPLQHHLRSEAERLRLSNRVALLGQISHAARYLPAMEVCCLTSATEGLPNLIMEASASGLPVVSTNCGGALELIEQGITGYVVPAGDDATMAARLDGLLANREQRVVMGENGRRKMRREFSLEQMVGRMTQVYHELLASKESA